MKNETVALLEKYLPKLEHGGKELLEIATRRILTLAATELAAGILLLVVGIVALIIGSRKWAAWDEMTYDEGENRKIVCIVAVIAGLVVPLILIPDSIIGLINCKFYAIRSLLP